MAIARAIFARPPLLLCDEPTGNLDPATASEVIALFRDLNARDRVTLLIATHEERVAEVAIKRLMENVRRYAVANPKFALRLVKGRRKKKVLAKGVVA